MQLVPSLLQHEFVDGVPHQARARSESSSHRPGAAEGARPAGRARSPSGRGHDRARRDRNAGRRPTAAWSAALSAASSRSRRAWTRLCTVPGTDAADPSPGRAGRSCSRNSGIAGGALDAALGELLARDQQRPGRACAPRRAGAGRGRSWSARHPRPAPASLVDRIAVQARGQQQQAWAFGRDDGQSCQMGERDWVRPMHVLDHKEPGLRSAGPRDHPRQQLPLATIAVGIVHGLVDRAQRRGLRQIEQIVEEHAVLFGDQRLRRCMRRRRGGSRVGRAVDRQQAAQQAADRVAPGGDRRNRAPRRVWQASPSRAPRAAPPRPAGSCRCPPRRAPARPGRDPPRRRHASRPAAGSPRPDAADERALLPADRCRLTDQPPRLLPAPPSP